MTTPQHQAALTNLRDREERLRQELAAAQAVDIVGVVHPRGVGGAHTTGDRQWTLVIQLAAWRAGDGPVSKQPLRACRKMSDRAVRAAKAEIKDYQLVGMRARVAVENSFGSPQAKIVRMLQPVEDKELAAIARKLKKPVVIEDRRFGKLKLDRAAAWFTGRANWGRQRVEVNLVADDDMAPGWSLQHARALFAARHQWAPQLARKIADLHPLWLESWHEEGEKQLTAKQFTAKMRLESVIVEQSGAFQFWYNDADLFWGHSVVVSGSLKGGVAEATIEG